MSESLTIWQCDDVGCAAVQSESGARWEAGPDEPGVCHACGCSCSRQRVVTEQAVRDALQATSRYFAGDHVNAGVAVGRVYVELGLDR